MRTSSSVCAGAAPEWRLGDLMARVAAGDREALGALYDRTAALVHGLVLRILGDPSHAEEVTVDVYLQIWRQAARWDAARGGPMAWILTIARTRALDRRRNQTLHRRHAAPLAHACVLPATHGCPERAAVLAERGRVVRAALLRLPAEQRRAIELAYFGGLSHAEIARALAEPLGTVKSRIRTAMLRLHALLAGLDAEPA